MDAKQTGWVAYCTLVGWFIAFFTGDREGAKFHINQALVIWIAYAIGTVILIIPIIGWILGAIIDIFATVCFVMGLIAAIKGEEKEVPLLGKIHIIK